MTMISQLSAQDSQFLYVQGGDVLTHVMSITLYDPSTAPGGKVRFKDIVRHVSSRCHTSPVFMRKLHRLPLDLDHPYWVEDPNFDVEAHVTHVRLPKPGDWRQFCILAARHFARPMDMGRPLWDIYVVEGLDGVPGVAPGSYALLQRFHHSAIDGASGSYALIALCDSDALRDSSGAGGSQRRTRVRACAGHDGHPRARFQFFITGQDDERGHEAVAGARGGGEASADRAAGRRQERGARGSLQSPRVAAPGVRGRGVPVG